MAGSITYGFTNYKTFSGKSAAVVNTWPCVPTSKLGADPAAIAELGFVQLSEYQVSSFCGPIGDLTPGECGLIGIPVAGTELWFPITVTEHKNVSIPC